MSRLSGVAWAVIRCQECGAVRCHDNDQLVDAYFRGVSLAVLSEEFGLSPAHIQSIVMQSRGTLGRSYWRSSIPSRESGSNTNEYDRRDAATRPHLFETIPAKRQPAPLGKEPIVAPSPSQLAKLVAPYLAAAPSGVGFAIGYASPALLGNGGLYFAGNVRNQFGAALALDETTPFEIASVTKTFTATLYALLIRAFNEHLTVGDYSRPNGPLPISAALSDISLDALVNFTSGLPSDGDDNAIGTPPYWAHPYSLPAMLSYLDAFPSQVTRPGEAYTTSNLAFALMSAIIASEGCNPNPKVGAFIRKLREYVLEPLGIHARFFPEIPLGTLPLGFGCTHGLSYTPTYTATSPGSPLFPAYLAAMGIVATPADMFQWLLFNMGITRSQFLTPLLPALHTPSTSVTSQSWQLGLGWFISAAEAGYPASIWKDGEINGFNSYMAFLPSSDPGTEASRAGAFVLVNADGMADPDGVEVACALANDILLIMQGEAPLADKSLYPSSLRAPARTHANFADSATLVPGVVMM
jgi:serine-type D-Ala-D-Ala carboxypeptidase/endopeptidase